MYVLGNNVHGAICKGDPPFLIVARCENNEESREKIIGFSRTSLCFCHLGRATRSPPQTFPNKRYTSLLALELIKQKQNSLFYCSVFSQHSFLMCTLEGRNLIISCPPFPPPSLLHPFSPHRHSSFFISASNRNQKAAQAKCYALRWIV